MEASNLASSRIILADLPPNSWLTRLTVSADAFATATPPRVEPVKDIISISGKSGLFSVVGKSKNNVIVESITDKKRFPIFNSNKISALSDISIYTYDEEILLSEIYRKIFESNDGKKTILHSEDISKLRKKLEEFVPNYDQEQVYNSDIKKLGWQMTMSNLSAGLAVDQLNTYMKNVAIHQKNARKYIELLEDIKGIEFPAFENLEACFWTFPILSQHRDKLMEYLNSNVNIVLEFFCSSLT